MFVRTLVVLLFVFILAACGQSDSPPTVGEPKDFATACEEVNKGQRIALEGFLRLPDSFSGDLSVVLRLYEDESFLGAPIGVQTRFGSEANQLEQVPTSYSDEDLQVHLAEGQVAGFGARVKVSGTVYFPLADQDFECGLENVLIEPAG
jgi:hypothetical protein